MNFEEKMFEKFKLNDSEKKFLEETINAPSVVNHSNFSMSDKYKILSEFYLAKQVEMSSESNDKHAKAMNLLTLIIAASALVQVLISFHIL